MYKELSQTIENFKNQAISAERKSVLKPLIDFIQEKIDENKEISINFICTHNSRRSHLTQIWAQTAATHFRIPNVYCFSGGTQETTLFSKVAETLTNQGFNVVKIAECENPIYAIKYHENALPIIGFSKKYDHPFNPNTSFAAVMTCSQADGGCPFIAGAQARIPITYEDPKISDNTDKQTSIYFERSLEIASEMFYVFSEIIK